MKNKLILFILLYLLFIPSINATDSANIYKHKVPYLEINNAGIEEDVFTVFKNRLIDSNEYLTFIYEDDSYNLDLLKENEFDILKNSYLNNGKETWFKGGAKYVNAKGKVLEAEVNSSHYLKGIVYVEKETLVVGSGSKSRPYKFASSNDITISKIYLKEKDGHNRELTRTPNESDLCAYELYSYDCGNRAVVDWNDTARELLFSNIRTPVSCVLWFEEEC